MQILIKNVYRMTQVLMVTSACQGIEISQNVPNLTKYSLICVSDLIVSVSVTTTIVQLTSHVD